MKVITLSEIPGILDEALQYVGDGKGFKNVMFLGNELEQYCKKYADYIENLRVREIKKISTEIDNT